MTVPTPDFESLDLTDGANWTETSAPVTINDQHNILQAKRFDGVNDFLSKNSSPVEFFTSGNTSTIQMWFKSSVGGSGRIAAERISENGWSISFSTGAIVCDLQTTAGNLLRSTTANDFNDGEWHLITWAANGLTSSDIYIDGVEVTYGQHNFVFGAGWSGHANNSATFTLGFGGGAGQFLNGDLSRVKLWNAALTSSEILEEFNNECAAVFVPTVTSQFLDLTTATFTTNGSPVATIDQHSTTNNTFNFDGVDDFLTTTVEPISGSSGVTHSISMWVRVDLAGSGTNRVLAGQFDVPATSQNWVFFADSSDVLIVQFFTGGSTNTIASNISAGTLNWDDGNWHHIVGIVSGANVNIYIDGVEATYATQDQETGTYAGPPATVFDLSIAASETGNNPFDGTVSRLKFWEGTALSACQVAEEFTNEAAICLVPQVTSQFLDLTANTFTQHGNPTVIADQFHEDVTFSFDGTDDFLSSTEKPIGDNSGAQHSISFWYQNTGSTSSSTIIAQNDTAPDPNQAWKISRSSIDLLRSIWHSNAGTDLARSSIPSGELNWDDGEWRHITTTVNGNDINIYIDGVEASTYTDQDVVIGGGFTGVPSIVDTLSVASQEGGLDHSEMIPSRLRFWEGIVLSTCQITAEFNAEVALIGSALTVTGGTIDRLNNWSIADPGLSRVNTVTEPFALGDTLARAEISGQTLTEGQIIRLNEWGESDPGLQVVGNIVNPFNFGSVLNDAMGVPPISTQLTTKQIEELNDWELSDPALEAVTAPGEPFNLGDTLNVLLSR